MSEGTKYILSKILSSQLNSQQAKFSCHATGPQSIGNQVTTMFCLGPIIEPIALSLGGSSRYNKTP